MWRPWSAPARVSAQPVYSSAIAHGGNVNMGWRRGVNCMSALQLPLARVEVVEFSLLVVVLSVNYDVQNKAYLLGDRLPHVS